MASTRNAAGLREAARLLRGGGCAPLMLRALRCCPLTATELCRAFRPQYRPRTVYAALERLRLVGLAEPSGRKAAPLGGLSMIWRST